MNKWVYEILYCFPIVSIDRIFGSTAELEKLLDSAINGRILPGKAITLGCGVGRETIYLAKKGFDVIGVDFSPTAIKRARRRAKAAGVEVDFLVDDLTNLRHVKGSFDLITDFGALNDLSQQDRDLYMQNVFPLTHPSSQYLMFCFEERLPSDEVKQRFGEDFVIEIINDGPSARYMGGLVLYLMTRITENHQNP